MRGMAGHVLDIELGIKLVRDLERFPVFGCEYVGEIEALGLRVRFTFFP